jgi:hypothetical protein
MGPGRGRLLLSWLKILHIPGDKILRSSRWAVVLAAAAFSCSHTGWVSARQYDPLAAAEIDTRHERWHALRRQALMAGKFLPPYRPISTREMDDLVQGAGPAFCAGLSGGLWRHAGCPCADNPLHLRLGGRVSLHELGPGDLVDQESGLRGRGLVLVAEPDLLLGQGRFWVAVTPRLSGPLSHRRTDIPQALTFSGWPPATGRPAVGAVRRKGGSWRVTIPRAVAGAHLGRWALAAGIFPASVGPGLDGGGLTLTSQSESIPQVVLRRTEPMRWSGVIRRFAPTHVLLRAGWVSAQTLRYRTEWGIERHRATPAFNQWLVTWNHTPWWRTTVTHAVLAAARKGESIWPDVLQANVPRLGVTWSERDFGPVTDRLFSLIMESRFRNAPWPLLPRTAGRVWWEYAGEDFRPHRTLPFIPDISVEASLAGFELLDPRWDLGLQFMETRHSSVLWYSNSSYPRGYTHRDVVLGHPLGGAVEAWTAMVRVRPDAPRPGKVVRNEFELRGRSCSWKMPSSGVQEMNRLELHATWRRGPGSAGSRLSLGWVRERTESHRAEWWIGRVEHQF